MAAPRAGGCVLHVTFALGPLRPRRLGHAAPDAARSVVSASLVRRLARTVTERPAGGAADGAAALPLIELACCFKREAGCARERVGARTRAQRRPFSSGSCITKPRR